MDHYLGSVTRPQLGALREFLQVNKHVAEGDTFEDMLRHRTSWETAAVVLNAIEEDCFRDWKSWAQLWIDIKFQIRQKLYHQLPSEGQDNQVIFSDIEKQFTQFIDNIRTPLEHSRQTFEAPMENDVNFSTNDSKMNHILHSDSESVNHESYSSSEDDKPGSKNVKRRRVIQPQLDALFQALNSNKWVTGGCNKSTESRERHRKFWEKAANTLNAIPDGDRRTWRSWAKYWRDYKAKANKKIRSYKTGDTSIESSNELLFKEIVNDAHKHSHKGSINVTESMPTHEIITNSEENNCLNKQNDDSVDCEYASDDDMKRRRRVSLEQLNVLWECLLMNRKVAFGYNNTSELRLKAHRMWKKTAETLNAINNGDKKTWKAWSKFWVDLKGKINHRLRRIKAGDTGVVLTPTDRRFLYLIRMAESDKSGNTAVSKRTNVTSVKRQHQWSSDEDAEQEADKHSDRDSDADDKVQGFRRVSVAQQNALWDCLNANKSIAFGSNKTTESRHSMRAMWTDAARTLNSITDGDVKTWKAWSKYWVDVKAKLNSRLRRMEAGDSDVHLTNTDLKFIQLIQDHAKAGNRESCNYHDVSLATADMDSKNHAKKKKKLSKQNSKNNAQESIDSENSSIFQEPSPNLEVNIEISEFKPLKQEHVELEQNAKELKTQKICTNCTLDEDSVIRNQTYSNLLMNELQYLPACMRSQAYINMLRYLESLKTKHNNMITNLTQKDNVDNFFKSELVDDMHTDPLNELLLT